MPTQHISNLAPNQSVFIGRSHTAEDAHTIMTDVITHLKVSVQLPSCSEELMEKGEQRCLFPQGSAQASSLM